MPSNSNCNSNAAASESDSLVGPVVGHFKLKMNADADADTATTAMCLARRRAEAAMQLREALPAKLKTPSLDELQDVLCSVMAKATVAAKSARRTCRVDADALALMLLSAVNPGVAGELDAGVMRGVVEALAPAADGSVTYAWLLTALAVWCDPHESVRELLAFCFDVRDTSGRGALLAADVAELLGDWVAACFSTCSTSCVSESNAAADQVLQRVCRDLWLGRDANVVVTREHFLAAAAPTETCGLALLRASLTPHRCSVAASDAHKEALKIKTMPTLASLASLRRPMTSSLPPPGVGGTSRHVCHVMHASSKPKNVKNVTFVAPLVDSFVNRDG